MNKGKHTPAPWKYYTALRAECVYAGAPPRDNPQGIIAHMDKQGDTVNAAFIVNAVNSHDQLVEALKDYKRLYEEVQPAGGWQGVYDLGNVALEDAGIKLR